MSRIALVTGASSGIGEATAKALAADGFTVYAGARRVDRMQPLADLGIRPVALDVTDEASMTSVVEQIMSEAGPIDVLVNNAGYGSYGALEDVPMSEARRQIEVNLFGLARMTQLVLPGMRAAGTGYVVNISSIGGTFGEALGSWYHASKYAVEGLTDSLALEVAPFGIRAVTVQPGAISTEWAGIAEQQATEMSSASAYAGQVENRLKKISAERLDRLGSPPSVVADRIVKIVNTKRPRLRYAVGGGAPALVAARRVVPERVFYGVVKRVMG
ncbi:oxidoreductase [Nocardioides currus]|uniref:Short-chain dehydrogenase/reductase n=1 Tax=Nocardioides currus TaxID=2133958 RepID=A0A2R7Z2Z1_9ACTN|nr:oxidoreductase [Nocardioides currus]PUA82606.1 short-chain dehydrogenase/reductase [Nocardioides currus]